MNRAQIKQINKRINEILSHKKIPVFPILGGYSTNPSVPHETSRNVTPQEVEILQNKRLPIPICIALSREDEFQEYLKT